MRSFFRIRARAILAGALILPLAACVEGVGGQDADGGWPPATVRSVAFFGGDVIVTGPPGYCVDPQSVQRRAASGFALLASCGHLSTAPTGDVPPAVITVSVLPRDARSVAPDAALIAEPWVNAGVLQRIDADAVSLVQLARGGDSLMRGGDPRHWRGAMLINQHLVGLAAYGEAGGPVAGNLGRDVLVGAARTMRAASPERRARTAAAQTAPAVAPEGATAGAGAAPTGRQARPVVSSN